jgi:hypothetical protein
MKKEDREAETRRKEGKTKKERKGKCERKEENERETLLTHAVVHVPSL